MEEFGAILCSGILPSVGIKPAGKSGFRDWCTKGNYVPTINEEGIIILGRVRADEYAEAITWDYERFALSAKESYVVALSERREYGSTGWPLLKHYYSSFFAAHALLRSRGAGVVRIEKNGAEFISNAASLFSDGAPHASSGMYFVSIEKRSDDSRGEVSIILRPDNNGKGVHEGFWISFCKYLKRESENIVQMGGADSSDFLRFSDDLTQSILQGDRSSVWLSYIRNEINYQHSFESWMPFRKTSEPHRSLPTSGLYPLQSARLDIEKKNNPVHAFINVSSYISGLSFFVSEYISRRSTIGGAFGQKWRKLDNLLKVPQLD